VVVLQIFSLRNGNLVIAGFLFCAGLFAILVSRTMPQGAFLVPGPGYFPTILGMLLCVVSVTLGVQAFIDKTTTDVVKVGQTTGWATIAAIMIVGVCFEKIGSIPMFTLFVAFLLKMLSNHKWFSCMILGIMAAITAYFFFSIFLGIFLPLGFMRILF
jgi:hypothetical protein